MTDSKPAFHFTKSAELFWVSAWVPITDPQLKTDQVHRFIDALHEKWSSIKQRQVVELGNSRLMMFIGLQKAEECLDMKKAKLAIADARVFFDDSQHPDAVIKSCQIKLYSVPERTTETDIFESLKVIFKPVPVPNFAMKIIPSTSKYETRLLMFDKASQAKQIADYGFLSIGPAQCAVSLGSYRDSFWDDDHQLILSGIPLGVAARDIDEFIRLLDNTVMRWRRLKINKVWSENITVCFREIVNQDSLPEIPVTTGITDLEWLFPEEICLLCGKVPMDHVCAPVVPLPPPMPLRVRPKQPDWITMKPEKWSTILQQKETTDGLVFNFGITTTTSKQVTYKEQEFLTSEQNALVTVTPTMLSTLNNDNSALAVMTKQNFIQNSVLTREFTELKSEFKEVKVEIKASADATKDFFSQLMQRMDEGNFGNGGEQTSQLSSGKSGSKKSKIGLPSSTDSPLSGKKHQRSNADSNRS